MLESLTFRATSISVCLDDVFCLLNKSNFTDDILYIVECYRMESVSCQLQDMYKESVSQSNSGKKSITSLDIRLTRLEEHMHKIVDILHELAAPEPKTTPSNVESARSERTVSLSDVELTGEI